MSVGSALRAGSRPRRVPGRPRRRVPAWPRPVPGRRWRVPGRWLAVGLLAGTAAAWAVVLGQPGSPVPPLGTAVTRGARLVGDLLGWGRPDPAYTDGARWTVMARLAAETVVMSGLAATLAAVGALLTMGPASRLLTVGELGGPRWVGWPAYALARSLHVLARSVPEVVWALVVVFLVRPGVLAGALALALHDLGVMGRLGSDVLDDLDRRPLRALRAAGASRFTLVAYGLLPPALPQLVTFLLYRLEVIVRAGVVVGFITTAGLGYQLRLDLAFRRWSDLGLVLLVSVLLVWMVDAAAAGLRRLAR